jgi:hypothetical protein
MPKQYPVVEIKWLDTTGFIRWNDIEWHQKQEPSVITSVGYLIRSDRQFTTIVQSLDRDKESAADSLVIPKSWVTKVTRLTEKTR